MKTATAHNKKLVLEAFDTLFNKRNYEVAKRYRKDLCVIPALFEMVHA